MLIIKSKYLKEKIYNKNLIPQEVSSLALTNKVYLNINNIEEFLNFASELNLKYIYYFYTYYNREKYIIPNDWYSEYPNEFKVAVSQHNQQITSLDFESPNKLTLFTLQNGTFVGVDLTNFWIENQGISVS
jgi:hypothetical protein